MKIIVVEKKKGDYAPRACFPKTAGCKQARKEFGFDPKKSTKVFGGKTMYKETERAWFFESNAQAMEFYERNR